MDKIVLGKINLVPVKMTGKSVILKVGGEEFYCSKRVYNELLKDVTIPTYIVQSDLGYKWLATPSRF